MRRSTLSGLVAAFAATALIPAAAVAQNRPAPTRPAAPAPTAAPRPAVPQQSQMPQAAGLIVLIKSALIALDQANKTGNYAVLHALGSDSLRARTNPQTLAQSFAGFRQRNVNLSPVIFLNPQLTSQPVIDQGRLHLVGSFPTTPLQITFDIWFEPSQGQWKFVQLNTNLVPAPQAAAPAQQAPRPPQPPRSQQPQQPPRR